ncbi:MAG: YiiX/YebB-like N1pC/P60 family cysteine hydrolase [Flavobacteriales bacterium]|jgi:hypothetical protein
MKKGLMIIGFLGLTILAGLYAKRKFYDPKHRLDHAKTEVKQLADNDELKDGDLIFQTSLSEQSKAIQLATNSRYSHCGIVYNDNGQFYVFEAIQPVTTTALDKWSDFELTSEAVKKKMRERYGDKIPMDEVVISPAAIFDSELLS